MHKKSKGQDSLTIQQDSDPDPNSPSPGLSVSQKPKVWKAAVPFMQRYAFT